MISTVAFCLLDMWKAVTFIVSDGKQQDIAQDSWGTRARELCIYMLYDA